MTATLPDVAAKKKQEPTPEQQVAAELVRQAKERGLSLTGPAIAGALRIGRELVPSRGRVRSLSASLLARLHWYDIVAGCGT